MSRYRITKVPHEFEAKPWKVEVIGIRIRRFATYAECLEYIGPSRPRRKVGSAHGGNHQHTQDQT